jgi:hypothetical protein
MRNRAAEVHKRSTLSVPRYGGSDSYRPPPGRLSGDALDWCRQRVQQDTCGPRGRSGDPLYGIRRALLDTGGFRPQLHRHLR